MNTNNDPLHDIRPLFAFPLPAMQRMLADFVQQMRAGLAGQPGNLKMLPTYMTLPSGNETGYTLAIDLGGTNLRVMLVKLNGTAAVPQIILMRKRPLARAEMNRDAHTLFAIVAGEVNSMLLELECAPVPGCTNITDVGFTFSYPVKMLGRAAGTIVTMSKELCASGLVGADPFHLLFNELAALPNQAQRFPPAALKPRALLNDTVTELIYGAYLKKVAASPYACRIGGIIGTGNNFAVVLPVNGIGAFDDPAFTGQEMIVNMESGNFDADSLPKTVFDDRVDAQSINPGCYRLEKMIAGNYLGRIVAEVLRELTAGGRLLGGNRETAARFETIGSREMSAVEAAYPVDPQQAAKELALSEAETAIVYEIITLVMTRAARVAAANIGAIVNYIDPKLAGKHTVAIDGSVFGKHVFYRERMLAALHELFGPEAGHINLEYIPDGSGIGAAIAACYVSA